LERASIHRIFSGQIDAKHSILRSQQLILSIAGATPDAARSLARPLQNRESRDPDHHPWRCDLQIPQWQRIGMTRVNVTPDLPRYRAGPANPRTRCGGASL
jgi:hypothetical protein